MTAQTPIDLPLVALGPDVTPPRPPLGPTVAPLADAYPVVDAVIERLRRLAQLEKALHQVDCALRLHAESRDPGLLAQARAIVAEVEDGA